MESAKLTASDAAEGDAFGISVAVNGDTIVVGAYEDDDAGASSGSVYVFERSASGWVESARLTASDAAESDFFGRSVALDRDTIVIGAWGDDDAGAFSGSAYVFRQSRSGWVESAKLTASDAAELDSFGGSVAVDRDTIVIGAFLGDDAEIDSGSAYVFALR